MLATLIANGGNAATTGQSEYSKGYGAMTPGLDSANNTLGSLLFGPEGLLAKTGTSIEDLQKAIPGLFSGTGDYKGESNALSGQLGGNISGLDLLKDMGSSNYGQGGATNESQEGMNQILKLLSGQLSGAGSAGNTMENLFSSNGATDFSSQFQNGARQTLSNGGFTPTLNAAGAPLQGILGANGDTGNNDILRQFGLDALQTGGYTSNSGAAAQNSLGNLLNDGRSQSTDFLQSKGQEFLGREGILPLEQVLSMARDGAGAATLNAGEKARTQAINRGGGAGATVANGMQNQGFAEFADMAARNESDAVAKALLGQQSLQLQQQLAGGDIAAKGVAGQQSQYGLDASLLGDLEKGATARYSVGGELANSANQNETTRLLSALGLIPQLQDSATKNLGTVGNLGLGAAGQENERLGLATDLMKILSGNDLSKSSIGINGILDLMNGKNSFALGSGNLSNSVAGNQASSLTSLLQNALSKGTLDLNTANSIFSAMNAGNNTQISNTSNLGGMFNNNMQNKQNSIDPWMQLAFNGMNQQSSAVGGSGAASQNPFAALGQIGKK
jgi:hypothetical protein